MLTRIRNANTAKHDTVDVPSSKMVLLSLASYWMKDILRNMTSSKMEYSTPSVLR
ncbi:MAG: 30S ribosomal protein S8 [[Clostridium] scindens]